MRSRGFVVGLTLAVLCGASAAHAQPAPQSDSPFRITAWAPKPLELPPYAGVHRPHWKLAELLAQHAGSASWSETLVDDRHQLAKYIQMAPGERTPRRLHPDTRTFWVVQRGQIRFSIEGQPPFVATKGFLVQVPYRTPYELETVGDEPSLRLEVGVAGASTLYPRGETPVPVAGREFVEVTIPGRGEYDERTRPYLDFRGDIVNGGGRAGMFMRDDRLMAVLIRGEGIRSPARHRARPPTHRLWRAVADPRRQDGLFDRRRTVLHGRRGRRRLRAGRTVSSADVRRQRPIDAHRHQRLSLRRARRAGSRGLVATTERIRSMKAWRFATRNFVRGLERRPADGAHDRAHGRGGGDHEHRLLHRPRARERRARSGRHARRGPALDRQRPAEPRLPRRGRTARP